MTIRHCDVCGHALFWPWDTLFGRSWTHWGCR